MSIIPSNLARVPNLLVSTMQLTNINRSNISLIGVQQQLSTGRRVNNPSDDAAAASAISVLDSEIERSDQRLRNMDHAGAVLDVTDSALADISNTLLEAQGIASGQINSDPETRNSQAVVVESLISDLFSSANREYLGIHVFGGTRTGQAPMVYEQGGLRYAGQGEGMTTDLGQGLEIPINSNAEQALGSMSKRIRGQRELNPEVTRDTRIEDLRGSRGVGVSLGVVEFSFAGDSTVSVDLSEADNLGDVVDMIDAAIAQYENDSGNTVLGAGRVSLSGENIVLDMADTGISPPPALEFTDVGAATTAEDLGLSENSFQYGVNELGEELNPMVTLQTTIASLPGFPASLGSIKLTNGGMTREIDLSDAETLQDVKNTIEAAKMGVRVRISENGKGIDLLNIWSGANLSVAEVDDGYGKTAEMLGIRTLVGSTALADYNFGRGVEILSGNVDPLTGDPDPARDVDFTITLANGDSFDVNLQPEDATTQDVIDRINAAAAAAEIAGDIPPGSFTADLGVETNAIVFTDTSGGGGQLTVTRQNGSFAADDLGLLDGEWDAASATFTGTDRTSVRVDSAFSTLIALRDALKANDTRGITFAGERLADDIDRAAMARALVGGRAHRVQVASQREEDRQLQSTTIRSRLRDLDYTEASIRFNLLQTQLQAGLTVTAQSANLSLISFLG